MKLDDNYKHSLTLGQHTNVVTDSVYNKLLENCICILLGKDTVHNFNSLCNSKSDIVKQFFAALLRICAEFVKNGLSKEEISQFLTQSCSFTPPRASLLAEAIELNRTGIQASLLSIGNNLPHVTDVKWKIDYIVKSNAVDQSDGPLFRVSLVSEEYDVETESKKLKNVNFTCTSQELQDLVYKLRDAVRHVTNLQHRILC